MSYPLIISFCTDSPDGYYWEAAGNLADDCDRLGLEYDIEHIADHGDRIQNCLQKPAFMRRRLRELDEPLMWVDADLRIHRVPPIQLGDWDLGLVKNKMSIKLTWLAGVIVLMPTDATFRFLDAWCLSVEQAHLGEPHAGDHSLMVRTLNAMRNEISLHVFPPTYCDTNETPADCYIHALAAANQRKQMALRRQRQAELAVA